MTFYYNPRHPRNRYCAFGDLRPSGHRLRRLLEGHRRLPVTPWNLLGMADIHIDLAVHNPGRAEEHINAATTLLDETIEEVEAYEEAGWFGGYEDSSGALAVAEFRRAELPAWLAATQGQAPTHSYDQLLTAAANAAPLANVRGDGWGRLIEFIPELLGARALHLGEAGWVARQALHREDQSPKSVSNWDLGITDGSAVSFADPPLRFNVKGGAAKGRRGSQIPHLYARSHGFADPERVIWGCVKELDGVLHESIQTEVADTDELNAITASLLGYFTRTAAELEISLPLQTVHQADQPLH